MSNRKKIKINVIMKEEASISPFAVKSSISSLEDSFKISRLFDIDEAISTKGGMAPSNVTENDKEKLVQSAFDQMSESEKRLFRIWQVELDQGEDVEAVIRQLKGDPKVESAEINEMNQLYFKPNDPRYQELYGLKKIQCECAWDISQGEDVIVAVIDTGVDYNHPDLSGNMWQDSNGHYGMDFSDGDQDPMDYQGHGSHVAGTIAAMGNNKTGIIGVAPKVRIMAVKMFPNAWDDVAAKSIRYAVDKGARIINCSWGPSSRRASSPVIETAIDYAHEKGVICVFAAGNDNDETKYYSPANYAKTISVGASDQNDDRAGFSNFDLKTDIAAPGAGILSLKYTTKNYTTKNGTSMACPHVAGACALLLSKHPELSFDDVKKRLISSGDSISTDKPIGNRLNVCNLLK